MRSATVGRLVAALGAAAICALTLYPMPASAPAAAATPLLCIVCGDRGGADVALNLLLFVPVGFGLGLATGSRVRPVILAGLLSLTVELLQLTLVPGRDASLSDLLTNTTGAALGALLAARLEMLLRPTAGHARRLMVAWSAGLLGAAGLATWLLIPDTRDPLVSEWGGAPGPEMFGGQVEWVKLDGVPVAPGETRRDSARLAHSLRSEETTLDARVVTGPPSPHRRWIYRIGPRHNPNGFLSQQQRAAVLGLPARALRFYLHPPSLLLRDAFPADSGVPVTLRAGRRHGTMRIDSEYGRERRTIAVGLSPAASWVLVAPFGLALGAEGRLITAAVLVVLLAPLGYWARAAGSGRLGLLLPATLILALAVVPALGGLPPVHWSEWLAGLLGAAGGWAVFPAGATLHSRCGSPSTSAFSSS